MVLVMGAARKALEPSAAAAAATVFPCCFASEPVVVLPPTNSAAAASIFVLLLGTGPWSPDSFVSNASASEPGLPLLAAISGDQPCLAGGLPLSFPLEPPWVGLERKIAILGLQTLTTREFATSTSSE